MVATPTSNTATLSTTTRGLVHLPHARRSHTRTQEYEAPDVACCVSNQAELSTELQERAAMAGYSTLTASDVTQIVECHCAGKLPLTSTGGFVDPTAHIIPHATGWGSAENAAYVDELHASCQSDTCSQSWRGMAQAEAHEPFCLGLLFLGGGCEASPETIATADLACSCAQAADRGAKVGESLMVSFFSGNVEYADYLEAMCAYDECHDYVRHMTDAMGSIDDEWQVMMGMGGLKNCPSPPRGPEGLAAGAIVGIAVGVICVVGTIGGLVAIIAVLAKRGRQRNAPGAQVVSGVPMAVATSTTVGAAQALATAVAVETAITVAPVGTAPVGDGVVMVTSFPAYSTA